jgi:hypothetical protein
MPVPERWDITGRSESFLLLIKRPDDAKLFYYDLAALNLERIDKPTRG